MWQSINSLSSVTFFFFIDSCDSSTGRGYYGDVFIAKAFNVRAGMSEALVVVKSLLSHERGHQEEFRREVEMFGKASHPYIVRLLAISSESQPLLAVYEYCEWVGALLLSICIQSK